MTDADVATHNWQDASPQKQIPIWDNFTNSPMLMEPLGKFVPPLVLTRNQCSGGCPTCKPVEYSKAFDKACWSVNSISAEGNKTVGEYERRDVLDSTVMLLRNPFEVVRSRANRGLFERLEKLGLEDERQAKNLQDTREGLEKYCKFVDEHFVSTDDGPPEYPVRRPKPTWNIPYRSLIAARKWMTRRKHCPNLLFSVDKRYSKFRLTRSTTPVKEYELNRARIQAYRSIPCYSEWLRYIQFHNYALQQVRRDSPRSYVLHYEKYASLGPTSTLLEVVHFLNLTAVRPPEWIDRKHIRRQHKKKSTNPMYTHDESRQLAAMVQEFASDEAYELLRQYFVGETWFDERIDDLENAVAAAA